MAHFYIGFGLIAADKKGSVNRIRLLVWPLNVCVHALIHCI